MYMAVGLYCNSGCSSSITSGFRYGLRAVAVAHGSQPLHMLRTQGLRWEAANGKPSMTTTYLSFMNNVNNKYPSECHLLSVVDVQWRMSHVHRGIYHPAVVSAADARVQPGCALLALPRMCWVNCSEPAFLGLHGRALPDWA
jgi:hypothetical protein